MVFSEQRRSPIESMTNQLYDMVHKEFGADVKVQEGKMLIEAGNDLIVTVNISPDGRMYAELRREGKDKPELTLKDTSIQAIQDHIAVRLSPEEAVTVIDKTELSLQPQRAEHGEGEAEEMAEKTVDEDNLGDLPEPGTHDVPESGPAFQGIDEEENT